MPALSREPHVALDSWSAPLSSVELPNAPPGSPGRPPELEGEAEHTEPQAYLEDLRAEREPPESGLSARGVEFPLDELEVQGGPEVPESRAQVQSDVSETLPGGSRRPPPAKPSKAGGRSEGPPPLPPSGVPAGSETASGRPPPPPGARSRGTAPPPPPGARSLGKPPPPPGTKRAAGAAAAAGGAGYGLGARSTARKESEDEEFDVDDEELLDDGS